MKTLAQMDAVVALDAYCYNRDIARHRAEMRDDGTDFGVASTRFPGRLDPEDVPDAAGLSPEDVLILKETLAEIEAAGTRRSCKPRRR